MRLLMLVCLLAVRLETAAQTKQATAHAGKAGQLMQQRRYREAALEFEQSLAADPENHAVRIQYATCLFVQERNQEARQQFELERQRLGDQPGLSYFLGQLDLRDGDFAPAIRRLQPLASNPSFPKAALYLGLAYLANGQQAQALVSLERAAQNNPRDPEAHYRLARLYSMMGRDADAQRQYNIYDDARESQSLVEGEGHACLDALRQRPISEAREVCRRLADPNDAARMLLLGQLYADKGAFADALEPLRAGVKLKPDSFDGWQSLGLSLYWLHRYQEAAAALEKAAALNPQFFDTLNLLAAAYHALGNDAAALPLLEQAHRLNPDDAKLAAALVRMRLSQKKNQ
jgi:tetratricopeptide (TPR) repeat protein